MVYIHYSDVIMSSMASQITRLDCLLNRLFRRRSKKTSNLRVTGLCEGESPVTGEFPAQRASNAEDVSISWRHHEMHFSETNWLHVDLTFTEDCFKGYNTPVPYPKIHCVGTTMYIFLFQRGVLWDMGQVHCGICEGDLLMHICVTWL